VKALKFKNSKLAFQSTQCICAADTFSSVTQTACVWFGFLQFILCCVAVDEQQTHALVNQCYSTFLKCFCYLNLSVQIHLTSF